MEKNELPVIKCLVCDKTLEFIDTEWISKDIRVEDYPAVLLSNRGTLFKIISGYGSCFDGSVFIGGICDKCLTEKARSRTVVYSHDYLFPDMTEEDVIGPTKKDI